jgi:hypothetical protein
MPNQNENSDLEIRLENWGRVMRSRRRSGQASSKEGQYRCPQRNHHEPPGAPSAIVISTSDRDDAELIESAVCLLQLRYHAILRAWYVNHSRPEVMVRLASKLGFYSPSMRDVDAALAMGKALLIKNLDIPHVVRKERAKQWIDRIIQAERIADKETA